MANCILFLLKGQASTFKIYPKFMKSSAMELFEIFLLYRFNQVSNLIQNYSSANIVSVVRDTVRSYC